MLLLGFMQWMLEFRNTGFQALNQKEEFQYNYLHVDDNFLRLAQTITLVPNYYPFRLSSANSFYPRPSYSPRFMEK